MAAPARPLTIDMTPKLMNRTAVYDIADQLASILAPPARLRFWRLTTDRNFDFASTRLRHHLGFFLHRLMCRDYDWFKGDGWPRGRGRMLFVDSIFCAHTRVEPDDIVLLHDIGPISNVEFYDEIAKASYDVCYRKIQAAAPNLVFVSDFTRQAFLEFYPADYASLSTIPLYHMVREPDGAGPAPAREKLVLSVGILEHRKNHLRAIEGFQRSGLADQGYRMALAGTPGTSGAAVFAKAKEDPSVEVLGFVADDRLAELYQCAEILLFPSLLEGFGVPAIEGPHFGAFPVISSGTVLEEVVGPDGVYVDPFSVDSIAEGLVAAAGLGPEERAARLASIRVHQQRFHPSAFEANWRALLGA